MNKNEILRKLEDAFNTIALDLLTYPENLEISARYLPGADENNRTAILEARCNFVDQGRIIGKKRQHFDQIILIFGLVANRLGVAARVNDMKPPITEAKATRLLPPWSPHEYENKLESILNLFLTNDFTIEHRELNGELILDFEVTEKLSVAVGQVAFSLSKIMHAIGRARGQIVKVNGCEAQTKS